MKLDAYCHFLPKRYFDQVQAHTQGPFARGLRKRREGIPALFDLDVRLRQMDEFGDYRQIISLSAPQLEDLGEPRVARELARLGNEQLAEVVAGHPDHFSGFVAALPLNDVEGSLEEIDYAIDHLGARGVQIYTQVHGRPLDGPEFEPIFERMAKVGRMIWVHPGRTADWPDYPTEPRSKYEIWWALGWAYDTAAFMTRLVFSGHLERHPDLKILVHHGGGILPHLSGRVGPGYDQFGSRTPDERKEDVEGYPLTKRPLEYFKMFYADTAMFGAPHAVGSVVEFYGADRVLFASDSPFDPEKGPGYIRETIRDIESLGLAPEELEPIFHGNAERLILGSDVSPPARVEQT